MSSERKLKANRENAGKSTGPRSNAGKKRSRQNAKKHGLAAKALHDSQQALSIERLARVLKADSLSIVDARDVASIVVELKRIRIVRASLLKSFLHEDGDRRLDALRLALGIDRYEKRAFSRQRRALRRLHDP